MMIMDNFCTEFDAHLQRAENAVYKNINMAQAFYGGIALNPPSQCAYDRFESLLGKKPRPVLEYFRKYEKDAVNHTFIHSDHAVSEWTAVLSLRDNNGGFCLWRHVGLDWIRPDMRDQYGIMEAAQDGMKEDKWRMLHKVDMVRNRCVIYHADLFHSRYPKDWAGNEPRLIHVFFFNT